MSTKLLYATAESQEEAEKIATILVEERLVACANILGPSTSIYWWEDKVTKENEVVIILKTKADLAEQAIARIVELHSYECPAVVALDIEKGNPEFLMWINKNTL